LKFFLAQTMLLVSWISAILGVLDGPADHLGEAGIRGEPLQLANYSIED
jgi:hypothetical protein